MKSGHSIHYDIHGLVSITVRTANPAKLIEIEHQLSEFKSAATGDGDIRIEDYSQAPQSSDVSGEHYNYQEGYLHLPSYRACFLVRDGRIEMFSDGLFLPVNLLVHLALLHKGYSLVHSAGVEIHGNRYLAPAFGGVGKTIFAASCVFSGGKLFGDDLTIIGHGCLLPYPISLSVYPYHVPLLRLTDKGIQRAFKKTAFLNWLTAPFESRRGRLSRLFRVGLNSFKIHCVNVRPRQIFGAGFMAEPGPAAAVCYLSRDFAREGVNLEAVDPHALAKVCTEVLFHEWHASLRYLLIYSAFSAFSLENCMLRTRQLLQLEFEKYPCYIAHIARRIDNVEYPKLLLEQLESALNRGIRSSGLFRLYDSGTPV